MSQRRKLELAAYTVITFSAVPLFVLSWVVNEDRFRDLFINLAATFAGAGFLFFLLNRFFGLNDPSEQNDSGNSLRSYGEIEEFKTSGAWADALVARINHAQQVDDVSWAEPNTLQFRWSREDREAHARTDAAISKVVQNPKIAWREICIFFPSDKQRFEYEKRIYSVLKLWVTAFLFLMCLHMKHRLE